MGKMKLSFEWEAAPGSLAPDGSKSSIGILAPPRLRDSIRAPPRLLPPPHLHPCWFRCALLLLLLLLDFLFWFLWVCCRKFPLGKNDGLKFEGLHRNPGSMFNYLELEQLSGSLCMWVSYLENGNHDTIPQVYGRTSTSQHRKCWHTFGAQRVIQCCRGTSEYHRYFCFVLLLCLSLQ